MLADLTVPDHIVIAFFAAVVLAQSTAIVALSGVVVTLWLDGKNKPKL